MYAIYPFPVNLNQMKNIPSNANINVGNFPRDIFEQYSGNANI